MSRLGGAQVNAAAGGQRGSDEYARPAAARGGEVRREQRVMGGRVVLVNSNEMRPPVAPLALDYIGGRLLAEGYDVSLADLSFASDAGTAIGDALADGEPLAVGVSFRNTDDCYWASRDWFVPRLCEIVDLVRSATAAPIVLGGCGFSIIPAPVFEASGADLAIAGDGEEAFLSLVRHIEAGRGVLPGPANRPAGSRSHKSAGPPAGGRSHNSAGLPVTGWRHADFSNRCHNVPGLLYRDERGRVRFHPPRYEAALSVPSARELIDNARYLREGAMGNVETKRGCSHKCIYCADPIAKGAAVRCRRPAEVADEIESLLAQGVDVLHLCDGEFNVPPDHALAVCEELVRRRLGDRVRWYCYATVHSFPAELATAMRAAGCVGVNFGVDSGCDRMLASLRRGYRRDDIRLAVDRCRGAGLTIMLDLLLGAPGEDAASVAETIHFIKQLEPDRAGAATGVRVYPGTALAEQVRRAGPLADNRNLHGQLDGNDDFLKPIFYLDRQLGDDPAGLVCDLIAGDERFFPPPRVKDATNYNYNDNKVLENAIAAGHRGAFWDILRRLADREPPL